MDRTGRILPASAMSGHEGTTTHDPLKHIVFRNLLEQTRFEKCLPEMPGDLQFAHQHFACLAFNLPHTLRSRAAARMQLPL